MQTLKITQLAVNGVIQIPNGVTVPLPIWATKVGDIVTIDANLLYATENVTNIQLKYVK